MHPSELHPHVMALSRSVATDGALADRPLLDAFAELQTILSAEQRAGRIPSDAPTIALQTFRQLWRETRVPAKTADLPLDAAVLKTICLPARVGLYFAYATLVQDLSTGCLTGAHVHLDVMDPSAPLLALNHAIAPKHAASRRLPGCTNSWLCCGVPALIHAAALADPAHSFAIRCDLLGIEPLATVPDSCWSPIEQALTTSLTAKIAATNAARLELDDIERLVQAAIVDDVNRVTSGGAAAHDRWVAGMRTRQARQKPP